MIKMCLTRMGVLGAVVGIVVDRWAGSSQIRQIRSSSTTCSYPQVMAALNAQDPQLPRNSTRRPCAVRLQRFLAAPPSERLETAQRMNSGSRVSSTSDRSNRSSPPATTTSGMGMTSARRSWQVKGSRRPDRKAYYR